MPEAELHLIFTTAFFIGLSGAMMPGPLLAYTISASARYGFWAGPLLIFGHAILELTLITVLVIGLDQFVQGDTFSGIVGLVGGIVLIFIGFTMSKQGWQKVAAPSGISITPVNNRRMVVSGIVISMSNPYWTLWWATVGMTYLVWSLDLGTAGISSFFAGHILADLSWYAFIALIISTGKRAINNTVYSRLLMVCGIILIGLGAYFVQSGIEFLVNYV